MDYKISDLEREALYGLPYLCQLIYLRALRPFMDFSNGMVGIKRGISYQSLREECFVAPHPGYKGSTPSNSVVRRAIDRLINVGILERQSVDKQLILKCCLASKDNSAQIKGVSKGSGHLGRQEDNKNAQKSASQANSTPQAASDKIAYLVTPPETGNTKITHTQARAPKSRINPKFSPAQATIKKAKLLHYENVTCGIEIAKFIAYHLSKGTESDDWDSEYLYWVFTSKHKQHGGKSHERQTKRSLSAVEQVDLANQHYFRNDAKHQVTYHHQERHCLAVDDDDESVRS